MIDEMSLSQLSLFLTGEETISYDEARAEIMAWQEENKKADYGLSTS